MKRKKQITKRGVVPAEVGERLKQLRHALGFKQQIEMSRHVGISPPSWNKYEQGDQIISVAHASRLMEETGATLDWIYHGKVKAFPPKLLRLLKKTNGHTITD